MTKIPLHPLINPSSTHYRKDGEKTSIQQMEEEMSIREMIGAMLYNIKKVQYRMGNKDDIEKEVAKLQTYKDYLMELYKLLQQGLSDEFSVHRAWELTEITWRYK